MIVQHFVRWCETANAAERAAGVASLATAWIEGTVPDGEGRHAAAALTLVLDDPAPKVRMALARTLAEASAAPRPVILGLCEDIDDIAALVVEHSPVLGDEDLIELAASERHRLQCAVAQRARLSHSVCAALVEVGHVGACIDLVENPGASIAPVSYRRMAARFGDHAGLRAAMLRRDDVPADVRQVLILHLGRALSELPVLRNTVGTRRAERIAFDACERATAMLADTLPDDEIPVLVEHLRTSGQLSTAFLIRMVCSGNIDLFAAALVALGRLSERRVRSIVVEGREPALRALLQTCGIPGTAAPLMRSAIQVWREVANGTLDVSADDVPQIVMERVAMSFRGRADEAGFAELTSLLHRLASETARSTARESAGRLAA